MERRGWRRWAAYSGLLCLALVVSVLASIYFGGSVDNWAYDFILSATNPKPWPRHHSAILGIDERTLRAQGGARNLRNMLVKVLPVVNSAGPRVVVIDVILSDREDPSTDAALANALRPIHNLVLASDLQKDGFEAPLPEFARAAAAIGHVHVEMDDDAVTRAIPLDKRYSPSPVHHEQKWALALEAFRLWSGVGQIEEIIPSSLRVGNTTIPGYYRDSGKEEGRLMRIRFAHGGQAIPRYSLEDLLEQPGLASNLAGKVVFIGSTAATEHDRLATPLTNGGEPASGIEINAEAFETMANGLFLATASEYLMLLFALGFVTAAGLAFRYLPGWMAYAAAVLILVAAGLTPYFFFRQGLVFAASMSIGPAFLGCACAAGYYHLVVRRNLRRSEAERALYQQKFHFATHELRTPLATIQASSELMARFPSLSEEKRKQILQNINSESKRLARLVEIFLNVERLSAGQMELKHEAIPVKEMVELCVDRTRPLAERKQIAIHLEPVPETLQISGDRELMEYACYNLLTNAVKYSPQLTQVTVSATRDGGDIRIAVQDQGIGMDQKEVKQVFQKFYRTKKAEESGEAGTGIGLSIVQQIVEQHGGEIEVASQPGAGSCFTLVLPGRSVGHPQGALSTVAERH